MATLSTLILRYSMVMVFASLTVVFMLATVYKSKLNTATLITKPSSILSHTRELTVEKNTKTDDVISLNASVNDLVQSLVKEKLDSEIVRLLLNRETKDATEQPPVTEDPELLIDRRVAQSMSSKVRVLCWIPSREIYWQTRLKAVNETWARRCDKTIYFMTSPKNKSHDVVGVTIRDSRQTLTDKTVYAHKYIYRHYLEDFDWFLKADDDTYVIMENLRFLLWHFNADVPGYIGCQFKHFAPQGYMSGGAGYAFNRKGIKQLVENGYDIPGRCRLEGGAEDIETGRCAYKAGVRTLNQLDTHRRQTFFPANVYGTALGPVPDWAIGYMRNGFTAGKKCCSQLLVSFHYTGTKLMYAIDFLLYGVAVYGRRFMDDKAWSLFDGKEAPDMELSQRRRPYPGETLDEYYQEGWREKNTTIYINPNL